METVQIEPLSEERREWARQSLLQHWGDTRMVRRGQMVDADGLPGVVALVDGELVGLVTYQIVGDACEILTIHSLRERGASWRGEDPNQLTTGRGMKVRSEGCSSSGRGGTSW